MVGPSNFNAVTGILKIHGKRVKTEYSAVFASPETLSPPRPRAVLVYHVHNPKTENVSITANVNEHLAFVVIVYYYKLGTYIK